MNTAKEICNMIGYRYSVTGIFGYVFYCGTEEKCSVISNVIPSPPVKIHGFSELWESSFDQDCTIFQGMVRCVYNTKNNQEIFKLIYKDRGKYKMMFSLYEYSMDIQCENDKYEVFCDNELIVQINRLSSYTDDMLTMPESNAEPYFKISFYKELEPKQKLAILSLPMIRFGI